MRQRAAWFLVLGLWACSTQDPAASGGDAGASADGTDGPESAGSGTTGGPPPGAEATEQAPSPDGPNPDSTPNAPGDSPVDPSAPAEPGDPADPNVPGEPAPGEPPTIAAQAQEFTRLTRREFQRTVEAALGMVPNEADLPVDGRVGVFTSNASVTPDPLHPYLLVAEAIAAEVVPEMLPECGADEISGCLEAYRTPFEALFRRAPTEAETTGRAAIISGLLDQGATPLEATRAMLAAALVSPDFLFRSSPSNGAGATERRLHERLSYALLDAPPDGESLSASPFEPSVEVPRLVQDPRAVDVVARFVGQWLDVDTDRLLDEDDAFEDSADYQELLALIENALVAGVPITELVSTQRGFVHEDNRDEYPELDEATEDDQVTVVQWPGDSIRRGLLGQDLFVSSTRHPDMSRRVIFRGLLVRRSLMCDEIPAPDPDLVALAGEVGDRTMDARCSTCHQLLDPIGVAFSALDPDDELGVQPAVVQGNSDLAGTYEDLPALLDAVASSRRFAECFSTHFSSFFLEVPTSDVDPAWVARLADAVQGGASFTQLVEEMMIELTSQSESAIPWCEGE